MSFSPFNHFNFMKESKTATSVSTETKLTKTEASIVETIANEVEVRIVDETVIPTTVQFEDTTEESAKLTAINLPVEDCTSEVLVGEPTDTSAQNEEVMIKTDETLTMIIDEPVFKVPQPDVQDSFSDLFGDLSKKADEIEQKKVVAKTKKATPKKTGSVNGKDLFKIDLKTIFCYHRDEIPVTDYFTDEEILEGVRVTKSGGEFELQPITAEMLRERLEVDFPTFVKNYTEMTYIKERNMVIAATIAKKKGALVMEGETSITDVLPSFSFPKKMPRYILEQFIALSQLFAKLNLEVCGEIYFNFAKNEYVLHIPHQQINEYWVKKSEPSHAFISFMLNNHEEYVQLACEIHSHHRFVARPSSTDNANERQPQMFYMIVGNISNDSSTPSVFARTYTLAQQYEEINYVDLFTDAESENKDYYYSRPLDVPGSKFEIMA